MKIPEFVSLRKAQIELVAMGDEDQAAWVVIRVPVDLTDPSDREACISAGLLTPDGGRT